MNIYHNNRRSPHGLPRIVKRTDTEDFAQVVHSVVCEERGHNWKLSNDQQAFHQRKIFVCSCGEVGYGVTKEEIELVDKF